jgi:hypothetical protein
MRDQSQLFFLTADAAYFIMCQKSITNEQIRQIFDKLYHYDIHYGAKAKIIAIAQTGKC